MLLTSCLNRCHTWTVSDECRSLVFPDFFFFAKKRLENHKIETVQVPDMGACELLCYQEPNCVSINFKNNGNADGPHAVSCDLNNATRRRHGNEFKDTLGYFYRGTEVRSCYCYTTFLPLYLFLLLLLSLLLLLLLLLLLPPFLFLLVFLRFLLLLLSSSSCPFLFPPSSFLLLSLFISSFSSLPFPSLLPPKNKINEK